MRLTQYLLKKKGRMIILLILFVFPGAFFLSADNPQGPSPDKAKPEKATFAGGCFWCMEPPYEKIPGVISVISGYAGGAEKSPTYEQVSSGKTGHAEAVEILFDPSQVSYQELLDIYWRNIDPTTPERQFVDVGPQYRTAIFYHDPKQKDLALRSKEKLEASGKFGKPLVTEIVPAGAFYPAEEYHQDYYKKNPLRYKFYRFFSGRDQFLEKIWGKQENTEDRDAR